MVGAAGEEREGWLLACFGGMDGWMDSRVVEGVMNGKMEESKNENRME